MDPSTLFRFCNLAVLPGWAMLVFLPRWRLTRELIPAVILPLALAMVYLYLVVAYFGAPKSGGFGSLDGVSALFQDPHVLLAGWIHYLVFDLFVGSWELRDSQALGISHLLLIPCLVLTFLFGPVGLLLYFIVRVTLRHQLQINPTNANA
jgi:hypothetical protein